MLECAHVTLLDNILSFVIVANHASHDSEDALVMSPHQQFERRRIPSKYSTHNFFVGERTRYVDSFALLAYYGIKLLKHD